MNGSASLYWPENGATCGLVQRPLSKVDVTIVQKSKVGVFFRKNSVRPSGVNAACDSSSAVEIAPGAKSRGSGIAVVEAYGGAAGATTATVARVTTIDAGRHVGHRL